MPLPSLPSLVAASVRVGDDDKDSESFSDRRRRYESVVAEALRRTAPADGGSGGSDGARP